ncbi:MAG TPA: hypothetical protein VEC60_11220, partial [Reyranella sp.]|nr:hypothetical protein [Reyranella sp.]
MARKGDVELVIRAKNDVSRAVQAATDDLKKLTDAQSGVGASAQKTDSLLGRLKAALTQLEAEAKGLTALARVARSLDQAGEAVKRLEQNVQRASGESQRLAADSEKAAASVAKLEGEVRQAAQALERQRATMAGTRAENQASVKALAEADKSLSRLANTVDRLKEPNAKLVADWRAQREQVGQLRQQVAQTSATYTAQKASLVEQTNAFRQQQQALRTAVANQRQLQEASERAAVSLDRQQQSLDTARTHFAEMQGVARSASTALGGVAVSQEAVSTASKRAADDIEKVTTALKAQQTAGAGKATIVPAASADTTSKPMRDQVAATKAALLAWREAQAQVTALAVQIKATGEPIDKLNVSFLAAQSAARQAKTAYLEQAAALGQVQTRAQGSFAAFDQTAIKMQQTANAVVAANGVSSSSILNFLSLIARFPRAAGEAADALRKTGDAGRSAASGFDAASSSGRQSMGLLQRLRGEVLSLITTYVGLFQAVNQLGSLVTTLRTFDAAQSRLGAVFAQNTQKVGEEIEFLKQQSVRLAVPMS